MIDPTDIIEVIPNNETNLIKLNQIEECDYEVYNLFDDKDFKKFIDDVEKEVRSSFEYKQMIKYIRDYMDMKECAFLEDVEIDGSFKIKIEQHHYPFTLYDISLIVFNKRLYYKESLELEDVAKEVMILHYKLMVGLIPLSETVHQLVHNKYIFIPIDKVLGRYNLFVDAYKDFMLPEHLDILKRIEDYSISQFEHSNINNNILQQSKTYLETDETYKLPDLTNISTAMTNRIQEIKDNAYRLPTLTDNNEQQKISNRQLKNVIYFF